jgi:hypothetical protein
MHRIGRNAVWVVIFFLLTGGALCLAIFQTIRTFSGASKPEFSAAAGELLLVIVLGVGEMLAFFELRHIAKEREFHCWLKAQEIWTERTFREGRGKIFERLHSANTAWTEQDIEEAKEVCRRMDEFARLVPFLGIQMMLDTWDDPLAKAWVVLERVVNDERTSKTDWSKKWKGFEEIGRQALAKLIREGRDPRPKQQDG